jgi:hypothetical protein
VECLVESIRPNIPHTGCFEKPENRKRTPDRARKAHVPGDHKAQWKPPAAEAARSFFDISKQLAPKRLRFPGARIVNDKGRIIP